MADDELVEVVDEDGRVTDVVTRAEIRAERLRHRVVFIAVITSGGAVVTHQRAAWKDVYASLFDVAFGGVVGAGERWDEAAARELAEEAGVAAPLELLGEGRYDDDDGREVARIYLARSDGPFRFADGEVVGTEEVPMPDLDRWLATHEICPDSLALVVPLLREVVR